MKRISLEDLLSLHAAAGAPYSAQYQTILGLLEAGEAKPVKASGLNGKKPALYREYWLADQEEDDGDRREELLYKLSPLIDVDYYLKHPAAYRRDREYVLLLSDFLLHRRELLQTQESMNERSFEIWAREKFLSREQGPAVLKRCGLNLSFLNLYPTTEPLAYYAHTRAVPQNLLILENKDPFYSMRRFLLEGGKRLFGVEVGTLIYGGGKGIWRSFEEFSLQAEPYMREAGNRILYFGDLDCEGIVIYENLARLFESQWEIRPFVPAYEAMLSKGRAVPALPLMKEGQNRKMSGRFFSFFLEETRKEAQALLSGGRYIPQEILNISDLKSLEGMADHAV